MEQIAGRNQDFMADFVTIKTNAKINLYLNVTGKRNDGYHLLESVMQSISLYDIVNIKKNETNAIRIICNQPNIPCDNSNIAYKAAEAFFRSTYINKIGVDISIKKNIPSQAGLGGGSADGAAVLAGLNLLCETHLNLNQLCTIGSKIGADVPFCLVGGTAHCTGIGDIIKPLNNLPECYIVIGKGDKGISTACAYKEIDSRNLMNKSGIDVYNIFNNSNLSESCSVCSNIFEEVAGINDVSTIKQIMTSYNALTAHMSGSGSAVYGIFTDKQLAEQCCIKLKKDGFFTALCNPENKGYYFI